MKSITLRITEAEFKWLDDRHWEAKMSRSQYAAWLLGEAIIAENGAPVNEDSPTE